MENEKCWICKRTEKDIENLMKKTCNTIEEDVSMLADAQVESGEGFEFFKKNKFFICGVCWRLLNGFIDARVGEDRELDSDYLLDHFDLKVVLKRKEEK